MTVIDEHGRPEPPTGADELTTLTGFLDFLRATLEWKTRGLDDGGLRTTLGPSSMTLGGLLNHLAWVEDYWFTYRLLGEPPAPPWDTVDWDTDPDWEWRTAAEECAESLRDRWSGSVTRSRAAVAQAVADGGLSRPCARPWPDGTAPSLRWVLVHMVEEYARHAGHADLLREAVDGSTGE